MLFLTIRHGETKKEMIFGDNKGRKKWIYMVNEKVKC